MKILPYKANSFDELNLVMERGVCNIIKAEASSGKTTYMIRRLLENGEPSLFLAPFVKDCEIIVGMCPEINRQFGRSEDRSLNSNYNIMIMTYNSFAYKRYNSKVRGFIRKVREKGELIIDEVDMLSDDKFDGWRGCRKDKVAQSC